MSDRSQLWKSNGKLLITGEYLVMEGANAFALPINLGQSLSVSSNSNNQLIWNANMPNGNWFSASLKIPTLEVITTNNIELSNKLKEILTVARSLSANSFLEDAGYDVETNLDFDPEFGFGTSSTLISNIANWTDVDPYVLLEKTFGGSGYDIACARSNKPILFQKLNDTVKVAEIEFDPDFKDNLYFVYLGSKQISSQEISNFRKNCNFNSFDIDSISAITDEIIKASDLAEFEDLISEHECIISKILKVETAKELHFPDFPGAIKSLGAWGGDFVLVTSQDSEKNFRRSMRKYGFDTLYTFNDLIIV